MRYKPERALTQLLLQSIAFCNRLVEMRYKPERALTHKVPSYNLYDAVGRNEV